jgi:peptide/nickel transport system permease protein
VSKLANSATDLTMITYISRRLLSMIPMLLGITLISFVIIRLAPGKPVILQQALNPRISLEEIKRLEKLEGQDKPLPIQYFTWIGNCARLNFGRSIGDGRLVTEKILERLPLTLTINISSLIVIFGFAVPLGVSTAKRKGSWWDKSLSATSFILFAAPTFWLALLLMQLICIRWSWLPISGITSLDFKYYTWGQKIWDISRHLTLPIIVSSLGGIAAVSRYMRQSMIEALQQPFIYTAYAKGLSQAQVVYKHALRNAILPIVTMIGLSIPGLLGGSIIFESLFALPGIGRLFYEAAMMRDINLIMAEVVLAAILTMMGNLIADIGYALVDPRIRYRA